MKTKTYTQYSTIEVEIVDKGHSCINQINRVWWNDDGTSDCSEETIIRFEKYHLSRDHAKAFQTTKPFKEVLKAVQKHHTTYNQ